MSKDLETILERNVNTNILNELQDIIKNLLNKYGLRYINGVDLDKSNGHFSLPKMMMANILKIYSCSKFFLFYYSFTLTLSGG